MNKSFICLVSCKPYDDLNAVIKGIRVLKNEENGLRIDPYLSLMDMDQIPEEDKGNFSEIKIGSSARLFAGSTFFSKSVEAEILKDKKAQFVFVGEEEVNEEGNQVESIEDKIRTTIRAGLPVILGLNDHENAEQLKEKLKRYLSDLSEEQCEEVTIVYQPGTRNPLRLEVDEVRKALARCRAVLEEVCGEPSAERMKILYSIPKFTPELLQKCLTDQIDGVCIRPSILPVGKTVSVKKTPEIEVERSIEKPVQKVERKTAEEKPDIEWQKPVMPEDKKPEELVDVSRFLARKTRKEECLIFCHSYDDVDKTIEGLKELAQAAGHSEQTDWLFALPFSLTSEIPSLPHVSCGCWNLSFSRTGQFTEDVHFSLLRERGVSFIVLGDRMAREHLGISDKEINRLLHKAIENGLSVVIGLSHQKGASEQLQTLLERIDPVHLQKIRLLLYGGLLGLNLADEASGIADKVNALRESLHSLYGEETADLVKILIEVSHYSEDPFTYLSHRFLDGVSLSSCVIKSGFIHKLTSKISGEKEPAKSAESLSGKVNIESEKSALSEVTDAEVEKEEIEEEFSEEDEGKEEHVAGEESKVVEEPEEKVLEASQQTVKEFVTGGKPMSEEEMEEWEQEHTEAVPQEGAKTNYVESDERRNSSVQEEMSDEETDQIPEPVEKSSVKSDGAVSTVAEGLKLVKLTVDECAERLAEKNFQETYVPSEMELESPEIKLERLKKEYKRMFDDFRNRSSEGWDVIFKEMKEKNHPQRESIVKALNLPLAKIMEFTEVSSIEDEEGKPWFEVIGLSKEQLKVLYEIAKGLYEKKKYEESAAAFFTLVSLNAKEYGMWFGYGMAKKMEKEDLETALDAFSIANSLKPDAPEPYIHASECYLSQGNSSEAKRCLEHGKKLITNDAEHAVLKEWADYLTDQLEGGQ